MLLFKAGEIIDESYIVDSEIGNGGFGVVYEVTDLSNDEKVALKVCTSDDPVIQRRFNREVRIMQSIDHKNVMKVLHSSLDADLKYFTMPLARYSLDKNISFFVNDSGNEYKNTLKVFSEICKGVSAIHQSNAVHRDIKPQNVLVTANNEIVVSDLGLGKFEERDSTVLTDSYQYVGTQGYIPPEYTVVGATKSADARWDVFQLGKTLYFLLTGNNPSYIQTDCLPAGLEYIIARATKENPDNRYRSVGELLDAIDSYLYALSPTGSPEYIFKINLELAEQLAQEGTFKREFITPLLSSLSDCGNDHDDCTSFLDLFESLPSSLLKIISINFTDELGPILRKYTSKLDYFLSYDRYGFQYAETVTSKMRIIYAHSNDLNHKQMALKNILRSAVACNRYAAMDIFVHIISSIKDDSEAIAIVEMLTEEKEDFFYLSDQLQRSSLHPLIQRLLISNEPNDDENVVITLP